MIPLEQAVPPTRKAQPRSSSFPWHRPYSVLRGDVHFAEKGYEVFLGAVAFDAVAVGAEELEVYEVVGADGVEASEDVEVVAGPNGFVCEVWGDGSGGGHGRILAWGKG